MLRLVVVVVSLAASCCAQAEARVYLLRGWFGVFSSGIDAMAAQLRARGIEADAIGHLQWRSAVAEIVAARAAHPDRRIALVGHSQGGNNIVDMARELGSHGVRVDLLVTLAPFLQEPVPTNVARAINYYQSPGWGTPLVPAPGFAGELRNIDIGGDAGTLHITIDKNARVQADIVAEIVALAAR